MAEIKTTLVYDADTKSFKNVLNKSENLGEKSGAKASDGFTDTFKSRSSKGLKSAFGALSRVAVAAGAAIGAAFAGRELVRNAIAQEDAVNSLNASLRRTGQFTEVVSRDLQDFASELQSLTRVGDETILSQLAIAQSFGATAQQSKELVAAALDLASAQGKTLEEATRQLAKTLGGLAGELGETSPAVKELTQEQLRNGEAIRVIRDLYRGFAEQEAQTFGGQIERLFNSFGDLTEQLGFFITKSDTTKGVVSSLTDAINDLSEDVEEVRVRFEDINFDNAAAKFRDITEEIQDFRDTFDVDLNPAIKRTSFELATATSNAQELNKRLAEQARLAAILEKRAFLPGNQPASSGQSANDQFKQQQEQRLKFLAQFGTREQQLVSQNQLRLEEIERQGLQKNLINRQEFNTVREELEVDLQKRLKQLRGNENDDFLPDQAELTNIFGLLSRGFAQSVTSAKAFNDSITAVGKNLRSSIANGFTRAFSSVGQALVEGESALDAFGQSILAAFGEIATQIGQFFILQGIGLLFTPGGQASGTGLIAAGAALSVLGGVLSATASRRSTPAAPSIDGGTTSPIGGGLATSDPTITAQNSEPQTSVTINIQGDVLDSRETRIRIAELLNEAVEQEGAVLV